jgi:phosphatidylglycerol:prolipoprotein diacylglycerol transferase
MHPIIIQFGPITIYSYGLCVALAFLAAIATAASRARRFGWGAEKAYDACFCAMIAALAGSRLFYVIESPREFMSAPWEVFMVWKGGLSYYGGFIGAVVACAIYLKMRRLGVAEGFDLLIPSVPLGQAIGRIGCFFNGCCFGKVSASTFAVVFPEGSPAYSYQLYEAGIIRPGSACTLPVHPTQLYETLMDLGIFIALSCALFRKRYHGQVFFLYFALYGAGRFLLEFLRADNPPLASLVGLSLNLQQLISLAAAAIGTVVLVWAGIRNRKREADCAPRLKR